MSVPLLIFASASVVGVQPVNLVKSMVSAVQTKDETAFSAVVSSKAIIGAGDVGGPMTLENMAFLTQLKCSLETAAQGKSDFGEDVIDIDTTFACGESPHPLKIDFAVQGFQVVGGYMDTGYHR